MISATNCKKGVKILFKDEPYMVIDYQHVKPGKGSAFVRLKMKNLITGLVHDATFRSEEKLARPDLEYRSMQYLYKESGTYSFMDQESYDQVELNRDQIEDVINYLKEQEVYTILYWGDRPIAVTPPIHMKLEIVETPPGVRGDTAQGGATKPATLSTGLVVQVPLFVDTGDFIKVDTRDAKYIERVKS